MAKLVIQVDDSQAKRALASFTDAADKAGVKVKVLSGTIGGTQKELAKADRAFSRLRSQLDPVYAATQRQERAQTLLNHALNRGTINQRQYEQLLRRSTDTTNRASRGYAAAAASLQSYLVGFASVGLAVQQIRALAEAQMELERIQARLRVAAGGDSALASLDFEFISGKAKELGLNLQSAASAYSALAVAARGTAIEGDGARKVFSGVATAAAAMGLSSTDTERALKALEQMISKGVVSMEELRQQLGDVIPGSFQAAARAMGVSTSELNKMIASGEVLATDLVPKLAEEWEKTFGAEAKGNIDRLTGATENFKTSLFELRTESAKFIEFVGVIHAITEALGGWTEALQRLEEKHISLGQAAKETFVDLGTRFGAQEVTSFFELMFGPGLGDTLIPESGPLSGYVNQKFIAQLAKDISSLPDLIDPGAMQAALERVFGQPVDPAKLEKYEKTIKKIAEIEKKRADRIENLDLLAWQRSFDPPDTIANMIDIGDRTDYEQLGRDLNQSFTDGWNAAGEDLVAFPIPEFEAGASEADKILAELTENFVENFQRATGDLFFDFLSAGEISFNQLWDAFKELAFRAIAEVAAKMATLKLVQGFGIGSGGGGFSLGGFTGAGSWLSHLFGGGGASGLYGPTASGGNIAGSAFGGALGSLAPLLAVGGAYAYLKHRGDSRDAKRFQSGASVNYGPGGVQTAIGASRLRETAGLAAAGIEELLSTLQNSTGLFITGMERAVSLSIRNDKKVYQVGEKVFSNLQDAVLEAAKQSFLNASLSGELDPAVRQFIERFQGDAAGLGEGISFLNDILDQGSGLSELGRQIKGFAAEIEGVYNQLLQMGLDPAQAQRLAGDYSVQGFTGRYRSLTGYEESEADARARMEAEAQLYQAELELERARLEGRKATLEAELSLAGSELDSRSAYLNAKFELDKVAIHESGKFLDAEVQILSAEGEVLNEYLGLRGRFAGAQAEILKAEIEAISKTLAALANLDISVGDLKLPKIRVGGLGSGSSRRSNLIDRWETAMERLIQAVQDARLGESTTGLTLRERVSTAYSDYQSLFSAAQGGNLSAAEDLPSALRTVLELAKEYTGGGTGLDFLGLGDGTFRQFFDLLTGQAEGLALGGRPGKIREGNVVFDRRFHEAQERQIQETQALRQQEGAQLKAANQLAGEVASETRETNRLLRKLTAGIDRISRVA